MLSLSAEIDGIRDKPTLQRLGFLNQKSATDASNQSDK